MPRKTVRMSKTRLMTAQMISAWHAAQNCVLPVILKEKVDPTMAIALILVHAHGHLTGSEGITEDQLRAGVKAFLAAWMCGKFQPAKGYPYTLQQTLDFATRNRG